MKKFFTTFTKPACPTTRKTAKAAFTLAEVLITLAIIGVVAALTIPNLVQSYKKKVVETRLARFYSMMCQAIQMSEIDNGPVENWDMGIHGVYNSDEKLYAWFNKYLKNYLKFDKLETDVYVNVGDEVYHYLLIYLSDGSVLAIHPNQLHDFSLFIDYKPGKELKRGVNSFLFSIKRAGDNEEVYYKGLKFSPYVWNWDGTKEGLLHAGDGYGCGETYNAYCTKLIQMNGWKIPDDYPLKF